VGAAIGPGIATVLLAGCAWEIRSVLWLSVVPGIVALAFIAFIREEVPARVGDGRPSLGSALRIGGPFRDFLLVTALFTLANSSDTFLLLKAKSVGLSLGGVTGVYLLFNLVYAAVAGPIGVLSDAWGRKRVTSVSFFYYGAVYLGFAFAVSPWQVAVLFLLYGPFQAVEEGVKKAYVSELVPAGVMASGLGVYHAMRGVMLLPASLLTGYLWDRSGGAAAFSACAGLAAFSGVIFCVLVALRRRRS
jgi:MFS family permease